MTPPERRGQRRGAGPSLSPEDEKRFLQALNQPGKTGSSAQAQALKGLEESMEAMPRLMALMADQLSLIAGIAKGYRSELLGAGFPPDHAQALTTELVRSLQGKLFGVAG